MIETLQLIPVVDQRLVTLLRSLEKQDWNRITIAGSWTVKDVAAHLLDTAMRSVSLYRDDYPGEKPQGINSYGELVLYLDQLNADWVKAFRRVSPEQIIDLLETVSREQYQQLCKLDPAAPAVFSVAWAGESVSTNAFHIAREYTEKFHHQMQIRDVVGQMEPLLHNQFFHPFIHTLLLGLPFHYSAVSAREGAQIGISIEQCGEWNLKKNGKTWELNIGKPDDPLATVSLTKDLAWRLFTKGITPERAQSLATVAGDLRLAGHCFTLLAVMTKRR